MLKRENVNAVQVPPCIRIAQILKLLLAGQHISVSAKTTISKQISSNVIQLISTFSSAHSRGFPRHCFWAGAMKCYSDYDCDTRFCVDYDVSKRKSRCQMHKAICVVSRSLNFDVLFRSLGLRNDIEPTLSVLCQGLYTNIKSDLNAK